MVCEGAGMASAIGIEVLRYGVEQAARSFLHEGAVFLAEQLVAIDGCDEHRCVLAEQLVATRSERRALFVLQPCSDTSQRASYLKALCHVRCAEWTLAERVLKPTALQHAAALARGARTGLPTDMDDEDQSPDGVPHGAEGLYLLGQVYEHFHRDEMAVRCYERAVELNPTMWSAIKALSRLRQAAHALDVLQEKWADDEEVLKTLKAAGLVTLSAVASSPQNGSDSSVHSAPVTSFQDLSHSAMKTPLHSRQIPPPAMREFTPTPSSQPTNGFLSSFEDMTPANRPGLGVASADDADFATPSPMISTPAVRGALPVQGTAVGRDAPFRPPPAPPRKSLRAVADASDTSRSAKSSHMSRLTFQTDAFPKEEGRRSAERQIETADMFASPSGLISKTSAVPNVQPDEAVVPAVRDHGRSAGGVMRLLLSMYRAYSLTCALECREAIQELSLLPNEHYQTPWTHAALGRCYLELNEYSLSEAAFDRAMKLDPYRVDETVEYYSTVLWHLKQEIALADLAQRVVACAPASASSWCVVGNLMSLRREPDEALRFFKRACSLDPMCVYAYTLTGHEYAMREDFESALKAYYKALAIDPRHYNALYGIGHVMQRKEQYRSSQHKLHLALALNPRSSTLHFHLACAYAQGEPEEIDLNSALQHLETSIALDADNPLARFERAKVLILLARLDEAEAALLELRSVHAKEAAIYYELGRISQQRGDVQAAARFYSSALDLDPRDRLYRSAVDRISAHD